MAITFEALYQEALSLSDEGRIALAERLLESVEPDPNLFEAQTVVARQRLTELESGKAQPVSGPEGLRRVREAIEKRSQE
ncbi:MAG TPA: addiction module protein [Clostridia bacterium]|nr:addiction module protein [Clostridia bacterium]